MPIAAHRKNLGSRKGASQKSNGLIQPRPSKLPKDGHSREGFPETNFDGDRLQQLKQRWRRKLAGYNEERSSKNLKTAASKTMPSSSSIRKEYPEYGS